MLARKHFLSVITLGAPLLAGMVSEFFLYIADSAMVGRLGTEYLAAIAIATLLAEIMWVIASCPMIAQRGVDLYQIGGWR